MNKKRRNDLAWYKYRNRVERWVANLTIYISRDGEYVYHPKALDVMRDGGQRKLKHTSTLCSCYCCSGYYKYRRHEVKVETQKLLKEFFEGDE
jgi:hypothetical protein